MLHTYGDHFHYCIHHISGSGDRLTALGGYGFYKLGLVHFVFEVKCIFSLRIHHFSESDSGASANCQ